MTSQPDTRRAGAGGGGHVHPDAGPLVPVEEHLALCLDAVAPLAPLEVALLEALDCVLVQDVTSSMDLPAFDNSSMDGYAVQVRDVAAASDEEPVVLPVVADVPAGTREVLPLTAGSAVRIMTGAPVPPGTGAVVPVEWTDAGVAKVSIRRSAKEGQNIRRVGEDVTRGELLLHAGTRVTPRHVAVLAATGHDRVRVHPKPRVVVLSTGSEIVEPGRAPGFGQIPDSNSYALTAAVLDAGAIAYRVGVVEDDAATVMSTLEDQLVRADVLVTTGGVSAGAYDTVKEVLSRLGTVRFQKVAMQPGMPQGFGTIGPDSTPIFTLPGNPVSAYVSFEVFVRPALRKMLGETELHRPLVRARAAEGWRSSPGKAQYSRVRLDVDADGPVARPVGGPGSHLLADLSRADGLAVVPPEDTQVNVGDEVECMVLERGRR
ncbi:MAG: gephyrin-like molybdotransferase Glp [Actinomycetes bacterium]